MVAAGGTADKYGRKNYARRTDFKYYGSIFVLIRFDAVIANSRVFKDFQQLV